MMHNLFNKKIIIKCLLILVIFFSTSCGILVQDFYLTYDATHSTKIYYNKKETLKDIKKIGLVVYGVSPFEPKNAFVYPTFMSNHGNLSSGLSVLYSITLGWFLPFPRSLHEFQAIPYNRPLNWKSIREGLGRLDFYPDETRPFIEECLAYFFEQKGITVEILTPSSVKIIELLNQKHDKLDAICVIRFGYDGGYDPFPREKRSYYRFMGPLFTPKRDINEKQFSLRIIIKASLISTSTYDRILWFKSQGRGYFEADYVRSDLRGTNIHTLWLYSDERLRSGEWKAMEEICNNIRKLWK